MKNLKKLLAVLAVCALMVSMFAGCGSTAASTAEAAPAEAASAASAAEAPAASGDNVVKIGVFEPASGDNGAGGKQETLGMQYANKECPTVEIGGTTYTVELDIVDNQSSTDKAPSAAQQLVNDGCSIVLGSYGSGVSIAASDIFKNGGVPAVGVTCTNPQVTEGNEHYFRICFLDPFQGTALANYAYNDLGLRKAYCLSKLGDDYSVGLVNYFVQAFTALGGEVYEDQFPDGNSDFTSYVTTAKNQDCDVFFAPVSTEAAANIIDQVAAQGLTIPMMAGDTWDSNVIIDAATGKSVEIYVTTFYQEGGNQQFDDGFRAYINEDATATANNGGNDMIAAVSAMGYDAYFFALEALKAAGTTDPAAVMSALPTTTLEGVTGHIELGENGDAARSSAYVKKANTTDAVWEFVTEAKVG